MWVMGLSGEVIALPFHSSVGQHALLLQSWASAMFLWLYFSYLCVLHSTELA
jgi:hypothetical protein